MQTKGKVYEVLEKMAEILREGGEETKVGYPRRTDKSIADEEYKQYIRSLEEIIPIRKTG